MDSSRIMTRYKNLPLAVAIASISRPRSFGQWLLCGTLASFGICDAWSAGTETDTAQKLPEYAAFNPTFFNQGGSATGVDLSRFEKGNPIDPGNYRLDVYVNGNWVGRQDIRAAATGPEKEAKVTYCLKRSQYGALGVDTSKLPPDNQAKLEAAECSSPLEVVPGSTIDVDLSDLTAFITIPQLYTGRSVRGYVDPREWDGGVTAGFLSYNANAYQTNTDTSDSTQYYAGINAGVNVAEWRLRYNANYNRSAADNSPTQDHYESISSYAQRDITALKSQLTLGQFYTPGDLFDSVPYTGAQLSSDDRMLPDSQRGYAPTIRGVADTNARVRVKQGERVLYETSVPPGPFVVDDLYNTGYAGDLTVEITEADGRIKSFLVPYSSVTQLVRPGVTRYSVTGGQYRDSNLRTEPNFVQGTYQYGVSNLMTAYTGGIVAEQYLSGLGGVAFSTPVGALAADTTLSRASDMPDQSTDISRSMSGQSYRLTYSKLLDATATNFTVAAYRFSSRDYLSFQDFAQIQGNDNPNQYTYRQRNRYQLNLNQPLGQYGSLYFTGSKQNYWDRSLQDTTFQAGYNTGFSWGSLGLSASRTRSGDGDFDTNYMVTVSVPLNFGSTGPMYMSTTVNYDDSKNNSIQANVGGTAGEQRQLSYNVFGSSFRSQGDSSGSEGASISYNAPVAIFDASISGGNGYKQASIGARGSVVAHPGGINFTQNQGETMAVLEARGAQGARVNSNVGAAVGGNGYAVVGGLMPYRQNEIDLDPKGTSKDVELQVTSQSVAPRYGAIVMLKYPTISGKPTLLQVVRDDGQAIPLGAEVLDMKGNSLSMVGQGGRIFLRGLEPQGGLLVRWGEGSGKSCQLTYRLPEKEDAAAPFQKVEATCRAVLDKPQLAQK